MGCPCGNGAANGGARQQHIRRLMEGLKIEQPKAHRPMVGLSMV